MPRLVNLIYLSIVLDNILLTVVVPIVPDFLYQSESPRKVNATGNVKGLIKDILESQVVGGQLKNDDYIPEILIQENGRVGVLFASKALVQLVFNPILGRITTKIGYNVPFVFGSATLFLSSFLFALVSSFPWLLMARSLQGLASSCIVVSGMGMIAKEFTDELERSKVIGHILGGIAVGVLIGYPFGGISYDFLGKTAPFVFISIASFISLVLHLYNIPLRDEISAYSYEDNDVEPESLKNLLMNPSVLIITGSVWISTTAMAMLEPCLPIWLMDTIHPKKWQLGTAFIPDSFGYWIGTNYFAVVALRVGRYRMAMLAMLIVGIGAISVTFVKSMSGLILPHFCLGLGIGLVDSSMLPLLALLIDMRQSDGAYGLVYSISQTAVALAYSLGPLIGSQIVEYMGFPKIMQVIGICNVVYIPILLQLKNISLNPESNAIEDRTDKVSSFSFSSWFSYETKNTTTSVDDSITKSSFSYTTFD